MRESTVIVVVGALAFMAVVAEAARSKDIHTKQVCYNAVTNGLTLTATPSTLTTPPTMPLLHVSCLVPRPRASDALRVIYGIWITFKGHDVAAVTMNFHKELLTSKPGWMVEGSMTATSGQLGNLSVSFAVPGKAQAGRYACQAFGVDEERRPIVVQGSTDVGVTALPSACISLSKSSLGRAACNVDKNGTPWVVIQRRTVGDVRFARSWAEYRRGFGDVTADHWLGLDAIYKLCSTTRPCQARFEFTYPGKPYDSSVPRQPSGRYVAQYGKFAVSGPEDYYKLAIGQYDRTVSTASDDMTSIYSLNGAAFSTTDADHDTWRFGNCARRWGGGGWWYRSCHYADLNGPWDSSRRIDWRRVTGYNRATSSLIMVRVAA